jgi:hypothetical protein
MSVILDFLFSKRDKKIASKITNQAKKEISAYINSYPNFYENSYSGEVNIGQAEPPIDRWVDYYTLARRAWSAYLRFHVLMAIADNVTSNVIGNGLLFDPDPKNRLLEIAGYSPITNEMQRNIKALFDNHAEASSSSYDLSSTFNQLQNKCFRDSRIAGDVLVIIRLKNNNPSIQMIDGTKVIGGKPISENNTVKNGVEYVKATGTVVAYHVIDDSAQTKRIPAWTINVNGDGVIKKAFLVKNKDYRIGMKRGLSQFANILESGTALNRMQMAMVVGAEKLANFPLQVIHDANSTGENPIGGGIVSSAIGLKTGNIIPEDTHAMVQRGAIKKVRLADASEVINNPVGAKLEPLQVSRYTEQYAQFFDPVFNQLCMVWQRSQEVIRKQFNSNYSASRAAIIADHMTDVRDRIDFAKKFCDPFYQFWLVWNNANGRINLPQLTKAVENNDVDVINAISGARWKGEKPPSIDPLKEVKAIRLALGKLYDNVPLTTHNAAVEQLKYDGGDWENLIDTMEKEKDRLSINLTNE